MFLFDQVLINQGLLKKQVNYCSYHVEWTSHKKSNSRASLQARYLIALTKVLVTLYKIIWMLHFSTIISWNASVRNIEPALKLKFSIHNGYKIVFKFYIVLIYRTESVFFHAKIKKKRFFKNFANIIFIFLYNLEIWEQIFSRKTFRWLPDNWIWEKIWCTIYKSNHLKIKQKEVVF